MKAKKGSQFERDICKQLSLWWTNGERDDVFWRTSGSGARAKTRSKSGKRTFGQYGDVQATDPIGQPLLDLCTIELKRGYSKYSMMDLLDKPDGAAKQMWEKFVEQAKIDSRNARTPYWMLITKRDRRDALILFPFYLCTQFDLFGYVWNIWDEWSIMKLEEFLSPVNLKEIKRLIDK